MRKKCKKIFSMILVIIMIFTTIRVSNVKASTVYKIGESWIVNGQWKLTFNSVRTTTERNEYSDLTPQQVVIINYTYENIGYNDDFMGGLYIGSPEFTVYDHNGEAGYMYPDTVKSYAQTITPGHSCTAEECYGLNNNSSTITLEFSDYDANYTEHKAVFSLDVDKVTSVSLSSSSLQLNGLGATADLTASVYPEYAVDKTVQWSSSNSRIVSVSPTGTVTAQGDGTATITAEAGGKSAACTVTVAGTGVELLSGISLSDTSAVMKIGTSKSIDVVYNPTNATNKSITWTSNNNSVASVDNAGNITAVSYGTAVITATAADGGYTANCTVTVPKPVEGISLDKTTAGLSKGEYIKLTAVVNPADASNKNVIWTSSNTAVALVDSTGKVTAVGEGTATITAATVDGGYNASCSISVIQEPAAPLGLRAVSAGFDRTNITWGYANGPFGFEIYRYNPSSRAYVKVGESTGRLYTNTGLTLGTTYSYRIRAYKIVGSTRVYGRFSSVVSIKLTAPTPTNLRTVSSSYNSISVSWNGVGGASGYQVYRATSGRGAYALIATTSALKYNSTGLATNRPYYYKIRAYRVVGRSTIYSGFSAIAGAVPVPAVPTNVKAVPSSYNTVKISWSGVSGANGYDVYRATSKTGTYTLVKTSAAAIYNNTGLTTNATYYYKVRAYKMVGRAKVYGAFSAIVSAKPILPVPANFKAQQISSTSTKLTWNAAAWANGYEIYRAASSTGAYSLLTRTSYLYYTNTGLTASSAYYYKIRAYRNVGTAKVYSDWNSTQMVPEVSNTVGNSWSNLNNGGIAASQGDWIYYRSAINGGTIYKMRFDGSQKKLVYSGRAASEISVIGDSIYYSETSVANSFGLNAISVGVCHEGDTGFHMFSNNGYQYIYSTSTKIYYCGSSFAEDGNGFTAGHDLFNSGRNYYAVGDWIYYLKDTESGTKLYKNKLTGDSEILVSDADISKFDIYDNYIYYICSDKLVYRMPMDNSGSSSGFIHEQVGCINVKDGWVYYSNLEDGGSLYKERVDGSGRTKLNNESTSYINVIGNWIFYVSGDECVRIKNDGTSRESL